MQKQNLLDFLNEDEENLEENTLSPDAKLLYNSYCKTIGVDSLPKSDIVLLEEAVKIYFVHQLITFIQGSAKSDSYSIKKAMGEGRVKDFSYFYPFIKKVLGSSHIKKENYNQRFKNLGEFLKAFGDNDIFNLINSFLSDGGVSIKEDDLQELYKIINEYNYLEVEDALKRCFKNGVYIRNINFLSKVLLNIKEESEFQKERWGLENKESYLQGKAFEVERFYALKETEKRDTEENNENKILEIMRNIEILREQNRNE